jgi:hypothetical protein
VVANGAALHDLRRRRTTTAPTIRVVCSDAGRGSSLMTNGHAMTTPTLAANQSVERGIGAREAHRFPSAIGYAVVISVLIRSIGCDTAVGQRSSRPLGPRPAVDR